MCRERDGRWEKLEQRYTGTIRRNAREGARSESRGSVPPSSGLVAKMESSVVAARCVLGQRRDVAESLHSSIPQAGPGWTCVCEEKVG